MGDVGNAIESVSKGAGKLLGDINGGNRMSDVYGQMGAASLAQQRADRQDALGYAVSDQQMQQLQESITLNNQDIARKQQLLASADPALIEAGHQALALMQGKSAASLKPLQDQRAQQRQELQSSLAQQLGPDYATSSQGASALNQFDQQTANTLTQAQQGAIGQYMGYAGAAEQFGNLSQNQGQQMQIANQYGNIAGRKMNAIFGANISPAQAYQGDFMKYQQQNATLNNYIPTNQQVFSLFGGGGGGKGGGGGGQAMAGGAGDAGGGGSLASMIA